MLHLGLKLKVGLIYLELKVSSSFWLNNDDLLPQISSHTNCPHVLFGLSKRRITYYKHTLVNDEFKNVILIKMYSFLK